MQVGKEECQFPLFFEFSARVSKIFQKKDAITTVKHVENVQKFKKFKIENVNVSCVTLLIESVRLQFTTMLSEKIMHLSKRCSVVSK
jgi:hypothetical protein